MRPVASGRDDGLTNALHATTLRQQVADALRRAILCGELQPGERLREIDLADRFGVSRNPVREAIGELEHQGLIVTTPNQAKMVVNPSDEDMRQAAQVRICLELMALRLAWPRISADEIIRWRRLVDAMSRTRTYLTEPGLSRLGRLNCLDAEFHGLLVEWAGNRTLMRAWTAASPWALAFVRYLQRPSQTPMPRDVDPHTAFVDAVERRDYTAAESELLKHLRRPAVHNEAESEVLESDREVSAGDMREIVRAAHT
jgi:DNA-binding GntR family transcriptional regulator